MTEVKILIRSCWKNILIFVFVSSILFDCCSANNVLEEKKENSLSVEANINSSEILIENTGDIILTNISIVKDEKEIIQQVVELNIEESRNIRIPGINGIDLEKEKPTVQNEGWITIIYDQGNEKKMVYWHVVRHASIPNTQEVLMYKIVSLALVILGIAMIMFWIRKKL